MGAVPALPEELLVAVFSFVPISTLLRLRLVSRKWRELAETDRLWAPVSSLGEAAVGYEVVEAGGGRRRGAASPLCDTRLFPWEVSSKAQPNIP